jgi:hypothetical protein
MSIPVASPCTRTSEEGADALARKALKFTLCYMDLMALDHYAEVLICTTPCRAMLDQMKPITEAIECRDECQLMFDSLKKSRPISSE